MQTRRSSMIGFSTQIFSFAFKAL